MAFWKKFYKSKHTGKEIDAAVDSAAKLPEVSGSDEGKVLTVDDEGKFVAAEAGGIEGGYVIIDITSGTAGTINSVKFNDVEKGSDWLKDSKTPAILSISQIVIKIVDDRYAVSGNWIDMDTYLAGTGAYTLITPDGIEFGVCDITFVYADDEINVNFIQLLTT